MSLSDYRGSAWLFQRWMQAAQKDIDRGGDIKPVKVRWRWYEPIRKRRLDRPRLWPFRRAS